MRPEEGEESGIVMDKSQNILFIIFEFATRTVWCQLTYEKSGALLADSMYAVSLA